MRINVRIEVNIGEEEFWITDSCELKKQHKFYANEHAVEMVDNLALKMRSAISPCFFDHKIAEVKND